MLIHCAISNPFETGGILIGNYTPNQLTAHILQITLPPKNSRLSKRAFYRGINGLKGGLDSAWNKGQYYLGEWHYHPNSSAMPSNIDKNQMIGLSQDPKLKCPEPILVIIGGYPDHWSVSARIFVKKQEIILNKALTI
jgi:integrative and conjugative element protein (TIGR02256 family)